MLEELCRRGRHSYLLAGDRRSNQATIEAWDIPGDIAFRQTRCWTIKGVVIQPGLIPLALGRDIDTLVLLGVVWWPFTSVAAVLARMTGKRVLFWGHGWTMREKGALRHLRRTFYRIPHALLFYGHMAKMIALDEGFRPEDVHVIYNSLDFAAQQRESERVTREDLARLRASCSVRASRS